MPSVSKKQRNFMAAVAHSPEFAKKAGVPQSVGKEFNKADKGLKFSKGGDMANTARMNRLEELGRVDAEKARTSKGKSNLASEKKRIMGEIMPKKMAMGGMASMAPTSAKVGAAMDPKKAAMIAQAMKNRPKMVGGGTAGAPAPMRGPTPTGMKGGGFVKAADGIAKRGKTKATQVKMAKGGSTKKYC